MRPIVSRRTALVLLGALATVSAFAEPSAPLPLSYVATPLATMPLGADAATFGWGGGATTSLGYTFPQFPDLTVAAAGDYLFLPTLDPSRSLSVAGAGLNGGLSLKVLPVLNVRASATAGWFYAFTNAAGSSATSGQNPWIAGSLGLGIKMSETFGLAVDASYRNYLGLFGGLAFSLSASLSPAGEAPFIHDTVVPAGYDALPQGKRGLQLIGLKPERVFPVFKNYYDDHALASVVLHNYANSPATKVQVTAEFPGYVDGPRDLKASVTLPPGGTETLDLHALFNDKILTLTEATKLGLKLTLRYTQDNGAVTQVYSPSVDVLHRDAITWDDDRHVAAFISARDPAAWGLARTVVSATRDLRNRALSKNLQTAIALHETLKQLGLVYTKVPNSPFNTGNQVAVDSVQFPQEALASKTGDCSDLTVLWCSLLESVGIETAALTIPGHIFFAFALDVTPEQAVAVLGSREKFLFKNGKAWVPVEATMITESFLDAWREGAREIDPISHPDLGFYPIREAWSTYAPVVLNTDALVPPAPDSSVLAFTLGDQLQTLVKLELEPRAAQFRAAIAAGKNAAKSTNSLALLYARYGQYEAAESLLEDLTAREEYGPAYVNLGNLALLQKEYEAALHRYGAALTLSPLDTLALAGQALAYDGLGSRAQAVATLQTLSGLDPGLARKYAYLGSADDGARAAAVGQLDTILGWQE